MLGFCKQCMKWRKMLVRRCFKADFSSRFVGLLPVPHSELIGKLTCPEIWYAILVGVNRILSHGQRSGLSLASTGQNMEIRDHCTSHTHMGRRPSVTMSQKCWMYCHNSARTSGVHTRLYKCMDYSGLSSMFRKVLFSVNMSFERFSSSRSDTWY